MMEPGGCTWAYDRHQLNTVKETSGELNHDWESDKAAMVMAQMQEIGRYENVNVDFTVASAHKIIMRRRQPASLVNGWLRIFEIAAVFSLPITGVNAQRSVALCSGTGLCGDISLCGDAGLRALFAPRSIGRPPTERARRAVRAWNGSVMAQRRARSSQRLRPGLDCTNTTTHRRHRLQNIVATRSKCVARDPRAFRPVASRPTARGARAPRSADLAWLCCGLTRRHAPPHAVGRGSTAPTPRQVGGTRFEK